MLPNWRGAETFGWGRMHQPVLREMRIACQHRISPKMRSNGIGAYPPPIPRNLYSLPFSNRMLPFRALRSFTFLPPTRMQ